jgi:hypothetical protein
MKTQEDDTPDTSKDTRRTQQDVITIRNAEAVEDGGDVGVSDGVGADVGAGASAGADRSSPGICGEELWNMLLITDTNFPGGALANSIGRWSFFNSVHVSTVFSQVSRVRCFTVTLVAVKISKDMSQSVWKMRYTLSYLSLQERIGHALRCRLAVTAT